VDTGQPLLGLLPVQLMEWQSKQLSCQFELLIVVEQFRQIGLSEE
jgi:hypothetical protein